MKKTFLSIACLSGLFLSCWDEMSLTALYGATPSEAQLQWHDADFYGIIHLSLNTYNDKELVFDEIK
ncbi:MAG: hypothetical protein LBK58_08100 [Prevotellaceae bacterium]|nr:hypothetical protein [Prevotellaceae bacterium]